MQSHTPGPWAIKAAKGGKPEWMFLSIEDTAPGYRGDVATCSPAENINGITRKECLANAHLIAAAPDLLECLKAILKHNEAHHNHPTHAAAREAIRKAEGRS